MILVDTSSWVHQIRAKGDAAVRMRVEALLSGAQACELRDRARHAGISAGAGNLLNRISGIRVSDRRGQLALAFKQLAEPP